MRKLSLEDKIKLFLNPEFWIHATLHETGPTGNKSIGHFVQGNRGIEEYGLQPQSQDFLRSIIEKNGVARVLDIGSGMGLALHDLKKIYGDGIETHGLSLEQEVTMFTVDNQHYGLAERGSKEFERKFDFIISNVAFRNFLFQDIALGNVVRMLRMGGMADIHFSYDNFYGDLIPGEESYSNYFTNQGLPARHYKAMKILVAKEVDILEHLHSRGLIDFRPGSHFYKKGNQGCIRMTKIEDFDYDKEA